MNKRNFRLLFLAALFFGIFGLAKSSQAACTGASPIWTATPDYASINACVSSAINGDTVNITAGNGAETWDQQLTITKGINLIGPGRDNLTITMGFNAQNTYACGTNINTLINYKPTNSNLAETIKITGFTFDANFKGGVAEFFNGDTNGIDTLLFGNNTIKNTKNNRALASCATFYGVIYNNLFDSTGLSIDAYGENDTAWENLTFNPGSEKCLYYEDNTFTNGSDTFHANGAGNRFCSRFNTYVTNGLVGLFPWYDAHGNQSNGNDAIMGAEIYNNTLTSSYPDSGVKIYTARGGQSMVFHNNVITSSWADLEIWEEYNDTALAMVSAVGTHNGANGSSVLTDTTKNWTSNRFIGYYLMNASDMTKSGANSAYWSEGLIIANTATTITANLSGGIENHWDTNDNYYIYKIKKPYIQHVSNSYFWGNMKNNSTIVPAEITMDYFSRQLNLVNDPPVIEENREFWTQKTGTFDGTGNSTAGGGVGEGLLASRPSTCTIGVGYWATDAGGNWNKINSTTNDGALYKCTATNSWSLYYTPYTYPHPLRNITDTTPPAAPIGLSVL